MSTVVALTPELADSSLDAVHGMLKERGLTVSTDTGLFAVTDAVPAEEVLTTLVHRMRDHDALVVPLPDPWRWSAVLDKLLGPDFRLLARADGPSGQGLMFGLADYVVAPEGDGRPGLDGAAATLAGGPDLRPNRYEHAMFLAEAQAGRSAGMRGSVGCALLDEVGDVIALGTNEVPRAGGGQYWADSPDDARDLLGGVDPAHEAKVALVRAVLQFAEEDRGGSLGDLRALAARFVADLDSGPGHDGVARALESLGRVVHAELAALASAARHGADVVGAEAVVTRPPCRQCLRQLIVTGVSKVRFLGPADSARYPFHADALTLDGAAPDKVRVAPFSGVTPRGYGKVFGRRPGQSAPLAAALAKAVDDAGDPSAVPLARLMRVLLEPA
ncbi:hypothetical protein AB0I49_31690 [Streptomyces sp. NPDC050617]|uniref:hypothetical protein n=1 Tax=Streptomyces sp. NPDC050617 TaxID=3154628 RepID=UPI0034351A1F